MLRAAAMAALALVAGALPAGCGGSSNAAGDYRGTSLGPTAKPAPEIALRNSRGQPVKLSQYRGKAVLLTFLYADCPDVCPLIAGQLHAALERLGRERSKVQLVAVSVDPKGDTPAKVNAFLAAHGLTGKMQYLVGSTHDLVRTWRAYGVGVRGASGGTVNHTGAVYGITAKGTQAVVYMSGFTVADIVHDVPLLAAR